MGKRVDSLYRGVRNGDWIKLKCGNEREFVVGGYTQSAKRVRGISSLLLGQYEGDRLTYVGRVGSGLSEATSRELLAALEGPARRAPGTRIGT